MSSIDHIREDQFSGAATMHSIESHVCPNGCIRLGMQLNPRHLQEYSRSQIHSTLLRGK